jgi:Cu(I)/Ag(I) efflux system periplasmic protein CusF
MTKTLLFLGASLLSGAALAAGDLPEVEAEVRRVDHSAGKVTLRHGYVPNLDMPPMTMVFTVQEPSALEGVQPGDRVMVTIERVQGAYTVKSIRTDSAR